MARKDKAKKRTQARQGQSRGVPGEGQGRRDEVGRSGVYPASGPLPPSEADIQSMPSWGQGERGAAGYEDSGTSEIWFTQQELQDMGRAGVGRDQVQIGQEVYSSDGQRVGHVTDVRERDLVVARTLLPEVFIPFEQIESHELMRLNLRVPMAQVDSRA
jgi:hypothetical protein